MDSQCVSWDHMEKYCLFLCRRNGRKTKKKQNKTKKQLGFCQMVFRYSQKSALIEEVIQGCLTMLDVEERLRHPFVLCVEYSFFFLQVDNCFVWPFKEKEKAWLETLDIFVIFG